jgi:trehalose-6-phosphatase
MEKVAIILDYSINAIDGAAVEKNKFYFVVHY